MFIPELKEHVKDCILRNRPVMIWGRRGLGKSQAIGQVSNELNMRFLDVRVSDMDAIDFRGLPANENGRTVWLRPDFFPSEDVPTLLFLDELDRAPNQSTLNVALQLVLDRKAGPHVLPPSVRIVAAGNGSTDRGTIKFSGALANRFAHFHVEADAAATRAHFNAKGISPVIVAFLHLRPEHLDADAIGGEYAAPSPRQWEALNEFIDSPRIRGHATALLGKDIAGEFCAFLATYGKIPSIPAILANPSGAPLPANDASLFFAVSTALARVADRGNFGAVKTYLDRLPSDYGVLGMLDASNRDATLKETATYIAWAAANPHVAF